MFSVIRVIRAIRGQSSSPRKSLPNRGWLVKIRWHSQPRRIMKRFSFYVIGALLAGIAVWGATRSHGRAAGNAEALFPPDGPKVPLGLVPIVWPDDNPYSPAKAELGWLLFFDKRLSTDQSVSCA